MSIDKKAVAKEWLSILLFFLIGFVTVPTLIYYFLTPEDYTSAHSIMDAYKELCQYMIGYAGVKGVIVATTTVMFPYIVYQFVRSIVWSYQSIKTKK